ncbi:MAG: B12-binding domain-containing radical SAM protein [Deltaproteobacteria bacterium]|nr:B12-binding domain-containing radical SAM protein [Deltaproteobacteria bacterium]
MRVLFVWPCNTNANWVPLGISILSALAKKNGHETALFDTTFYRIKRKGYVNTTQESVKQGQYIGATDFEKLMDFREKTFEEVADEFQRKVDSFRPDVIAMSLMTQFFELGRDLLNSLTGESSKIPVIAGGPHAHVAAEEMLVSHQCFDIACTGDGEGPFMSLLERLEAGKDHTKIPGLYVKTAQGIIKNDPPPLSDLDENPCPDMDVFDDRYFYQPYLTGVYRIASYETQRGCPYRCTYCINEFLQKKTMGQRRYNRRRSLSKVISDLKFLKQKYDLDIIRFVDETFLLFPEEKIREFSDAYRKEIGLPFFITTRPDGLTVEKTRILMDMGCTAASIGIEHGNPELREKVLGRKMTDDQIITAFRNLRDVCIRSSAYNLIGIPHETRETLFDTVSLNRKADPDSVTAFLLFPYRKTAIHGMSLSGNFIPADFNDETPFHDFCDSVLSLPGISRQELSGFKKMFAAYVYLPETVYPLIKRAERGDAAAEVICAELNEIVLDLQKKRQSTKVQLAALESLRKRKEQVALA